MNPRYGSVVAFALVAVVWLVMPLHVSAQSKADPAPTGSTAVQRGEAWFYQRCALCHVGRTVVDDKYQPMGPSLGGVLKGATPEREKTVREFIERGSLRMPGFRYNLGPGQFDELMAYLKTL
jgi:mono/diheme cytochrome c family protein